jgi:DNA polymerase-3 subunit alpha
MPQYCSLHNHTEFSLLDGNAKIDKLMDKACKCGMKAIGISDHGNMFGVPKFVLAARKLGLKPIVGSEFYICEDKIQNKEKGNKTFHQILFAKTNEGYRNLIRLSSIAYQEGFYYKPRIDKDLLAQHSKGVIATTCCLASEINQMLMNGRKEDAEKLFRWYLNIFGQDYYVELQDHGLKDQRECNHTLIEWAQKYNVKMIVTNDVHYVEEIDSEAHDLLLALQTNSDYYKTDRFRFTDDNNQLNRNFYLKTPVEMEALFPDHPEALENTVELADKCEFEMDLASNLLLPVFQVPAEFGSMDDYLAHLTWEGAKKKYGEITAEISERIETELGIIKQVGYAGYFLIVQEFTNEARKRGVFVGPGRGSAAGSVVAYCIGIIDVDPITYNLLFERFLNPERVSPPDIDIDFDDEGREEVINFVVEKYGRESVSQVITFGTMGAKTALRDVGRTLGVPLAEVNRIAKLIPERPGVTFKKALDPEENPDGAVELKEAFQSKDQKIAKMMEYAQALEGTTRHTGVHACAVIITPGKLSDYVPLSVNTGKSPVVTTQFDGPHAEMAGMLKMDFLGLKTLSIIKTAAKLVKQNHGVVIDPDRIPLDDPKTYELYQNGETVATFQFESDGMRKYLRQLKPTNIEDLIAMNALYRPGPMDNIPSFIERKHGREEIIYPHPLLEPILKNTYGIMVYQEQIMECAKVLGGYSLGGADLLRRAMGKKKADVMEKERSKFVEGCAKVNNIPKEQAEEIFSVMEKFASYGFNKSHSAAYSVLAFRTAYFKAHYPHEYMASVLSHNLDSIDDITFFIEECRRMKIDVLPPCVNESQYLFSVNKSQQIRFGLGAIKGVGESSAKAIIEEREKGGTFKSIFDLTLRMPAKYVNKKVLESLAYAGAFDTFGEENRAAYFYTSGEESNAIEKAIQYGQKMQAEKNSSQFSLFGGGGSASAQSVIVEPTLPKCDGWSLLTKLNFEKETIGFYLSAHPLDNFKKEIEYFRFTPIASMEEIKGKEIRIAGIVTQLQERTTKNGSRFAIFTLEDASGAVEIALFNENYGEYRNYVNVDQAVCVIGKMEPSYRDQEKLEFRVNKKNGIRFLEGLLADTVKEMQIKLKLSQINETLIQELEQNLLAFRGKCSLKFHIEDEETQNSIILHSRNVMLQPSAELFKILDGLPINYVLN